MGISAVKKLPEDVAKNLLHDEVHTTLLAMGVPLKKIEVCDEVISDEFSKVKKMPEKEAFDYMVEKAKECFLKAGMEKSVIDSLKFE
jgi:hypothetical protein